MGSILQHHTQKRVHRGQRGKDRRKRAQRTCKKCLNEGRSIDTAKKCEGSAPRGKCQKSTLGVTSEDNR